MLNRPNRRTVIAGVAALSAATRVKAAASPHKPVLLIGHRGAPALRPEHTLASYAKAVADGADSIEPDLVCTQDGVLVIRHENNIVETTDVSAHPEFASRRTTKIIDGERQVGWFTEDFTLAELKTLRARERLPLVRPANTAMDGRFDILTWAEMIDFAAGESLARGRMIGLVPEIKHSTYFRSIGLPLEERFLASLAGHSYCRSAPIIVQSFEVENLRAIRTKLGRPSNVRLMQLVDNEAPDTGPADHAAASYAAMMTADGIAAVARYADILAPNTRAIIPLGRDDRLGAPTNLVADAHQFGLAVMPWTFRPENSFLAANFRSAGGVDARSPQGSIAEMRTYLATGIDGFFTDDPALGRLAIASLDLQRSARPL